MSNECRRFKAESGVLEALPVDLSINVLLSFRWKLSNESIQNFGSWSFKKATCKQSVVSVVLLYWVLWSDEQHQPKRVGRPLFLWTCIQSATKLQLLRRSAQTQRRRCPRKVPCKKNLIRVEKGPYAKKKTRVTVDCWAWTNPSSSFLHAQLKACKAHLQAITRLSETTSSISHI